MKLEKYISDLLYRYDLVIVPGFGGIIGRKKPARLDRDTFIFSPPHKDLSFNVQLQQNDGLLANYIADVSGMSYAESLRAIEATIREWHRILRDEKRLKLEQIGIFNLVSDDKILFLPLTTKNYLAEAYGLPAFVYKPLNINVSKAPEKPEQEQVTISKPNSDISVQPVVNTQSRKKIPVQKQRKDYQFWKYAAVFVVGLGLFTAGISFLRHKNQIQNQNFQKATFVLKQDFPPVKIKSRPENDLNTSKEEKSAINTEKYFIISGAFRNKTNAEKKVKALQQNGYHAKIIGQNKYGLWMVAYQGFTSNDDAHRALKTLKTREPGAWVFAKN